MSSGLEMVTNVLGETRVVSDEADAQANENGWPGMAMCKAMIEASLASLRPREIIQ